MRILKCAIDELGARSETVLFSWIINEDRLLGFQVGGPK